MSKFAIFNADGTLSHTGSCPDGHEELQAQPGQILHIGEVGGLDRIDPATREIIPVAIPPQSTPIAPPAYVARRMAAYPSMAQQMDWLWHAMNSGQMPKAEPFYSQLKAVKDAYPKAVDPSEGAEHTEDL